MDAVLRAFVGKEFNQQAAGRGDHRELTDRVQPGPATRPSPSSVSDPYRLGPGAVIDQRLDILVVNNCQQTSLPLIHPRLRHPSIRHSGPGSRLRTRRPSVASGLCQH